MSYTFTQHAEPGTRYARDAFAAAIGLPVNVRAGEQTRRAVIQRAWIAEDGQSVQITVDTDLSDMAEAPGGFSLSLH
ncbi:MAG TPA: hypothetical protein VIQ30_13585, partial [Pseudonocardia sp.]